MPRWSDAMRLDQVEFFRDELRGETGVYEIGFVRDGVFLPKYIGRARTPTSCLYTRLSSYTNPNRCHNKFIYLKIQAYYYNLWCHVYRASDPAATEARMLDRHMIRRDGGLYEWNLRYEPLP